MPAVSALPSDPGVCWGVQRTGGTGQVFSGPPAPANHGTAKTQGRAPETEAVKTQRHARKIKHWLD